MLKKKSRGRRKQKVISPASTSITTDGMLILDVREPTPEDFVRSSQSQLKKDDVKSDIKTELLPLEEVEKLLKRAPEIKCEKDDEKRFFKREKTLPAPKTGERVKISFPPKEVIEKPDILKKEEEEMKKELKILRYSPQGKDLNVVPEVVITFNQPMVPVTSVEKLKELKVPVVLTPKIEGEWRWLGTKTIKWKPTDRLPKSTVFNVTVPKGTKSELGCELKKELKFQFSTVTLGFNKKFPEGAYSKLSPKGIVHIEFNQKINQNDVFKSLSVLGSDRKIYEISPLKKEEVRKLIDSGEMKKKLRHLYSSYENYLKNSIDNQSVWFTFKKPLALHQTFTCTLAKGAKSEEGPRMTEKNQSFVFYTYGPMKMESRYPRTTDKIIPMQSWSIYFTNNIECDEFNPEIVKVTPKVPNLKVTAAGKYITIRGQTKGRTKYTVVVNKQLKDVYGQSLNPPVKEVFNVGPARQSLQGFHNNQVVVIDPTMKADPDFCVISVNVKKIRVVVFHVHPSEFHKSKIGSDYYRYGNSSKEAKAYVNAGKIVSDKVINVKGKDDEIAETKIILTKHLQNKTTGQLIIYVEPTKDSWKEKPRICTWVQVTELAVQAHATFRECYCWCTDLKDGSSVENAKFTILGPLGVVVKSYKDFEHQIIGGKDGLALFTDYKKGNSICWVEKEKDIAFVHRIPFYNQPSKRYLNYIINDRGLYKPKETVSIKGILRSLDFKEQKKVLDFPDIKKLKYEAFDSRGNKFKEGNVNISKFGTFFLTIDLPDNINLGQGYVRFQSKNPYFYYNHHFKSASVDPGPYTVNNLAIVKGKAEYYSGGGLGGCDAKWNVTQSNTSYSPPGWGYKGYSFACSYYPYKDGVPQSFPQGGSKELKGFTDSSGEHKCCVDFKENDSAIVKKPVSITTNFEVQDINRQTMSSSTSFIVHPSNLKKYFAKVEDFIPVDIIVCDIEGNLVEGIDVELKILLRYSEQKGYKWINKEDVVEKLKITSKKEPIEVNVQIKKGGSYLFVCSIKDKIGLPNFCSASIWCAGGKDNKKGSSISCEIVKLIGNKKKYEVGDEAKILVSNPLLVPADGLLLVYSGNGFSQQDRFVMTDDNFIVSVKIKEEHIPNLLVKVFLCGKNDRGDETGRPNETAPKRPAFASGTLSLSVPPTARKIEMEIENKKVMKPGETGKVDVQLKGTDVKNANCTLIIVDEALVGHSLSNPLSSFYPHTYCASSDIYLRSLVFVKNWNSISFQAPPEPEPCVPVCCCEGCFCDCRRSCGRCRRNCCPCCPMPMSKCCKKKKKKKGKRKCKKEKESEEKGSSGEDDSPIDVRKDFKPLICFIADKKSDENGKVSFDFKLKDNLTRYRVWIIAENTKHYFGLGESSIQAQLPVSIRPSIPRFLNFGDKSEFTVVIQNQTLDKVEVNVAVRMTNLVLSDPKRQGVKVVIPYTKRAELRFPVVTKKCGKGRFQVIASVVGMKFADAVEKTLPIFTPSTSEAFATYGEVDNDGAVIQSILPPPDIYNEFGGLEIATSSTALQSLTDAFLYLYRYEFNCVEQISSKMMSIFALQDILFAFNVPKMPSKAELQKVIDTGIKKIKSSQRSDGCVGFWSLRSDVNIYLSIHIAHVQIRGVEQGYKMNETTLNRSKTFCQNVEVYLNRYCNWYGPWSRASLRSFALYTLAHYYINKKLTSHEKDKALKQAEDLYKKLEKYLSMEGKACSKAKHPIVVKIMKDFLNKVNVTAETANFVTSYGDDGKLVMLHSNRRTDGIILEVLMHLDQKNELIVKLVKGLLAHKKKGRWKSTQENVYILLALKKYFKTFEKVVPNFIARIWLGEEYTGEVKFKGRETETRIIKVPMKTIVPDDSKKDYDKKDLVLFKQGAGRMYYRIGMDYAPKNLFLKAVDYGFIVERTYEGVSDKNHVLFDKEKNRWVFKAGELIRAKLRLTNASRRYHVALVDFLPAGCEVLNPELKGTSAEASKEKQTQQSGKGLGGRGGRWGWWYWYWRPWYEHTNMRDERVEAFTSYLYCGVHDFSYLMRATSFGEYVIPPTKAEEMYSPEIFGRSDSTKVLIQ